MIFCFPLLSVGQYIRIVYSAGGVAVSESYIISKFKQCIRTIFMLVLSFQIHYEVNNFQNQDFLHVLLYDEAAFTKDIIHNTHNAYYYFLLVTILTSGKVLHIF